MTRRNSRRVKGVDLGAVRAEIRAMIATKTLAATADQIVEADGISFAINDGDRLTTVWVPPRETEVRHG